MKHSLAIKRAIHQSGLASALRRLALVNSVAILRYHAVIDPEKCDYAAPGICTAPAVFERQIAFLANHCNVISLDDVAVCIRNGRPFPKGAVVLTFDDGYRDNYRAHLILKKYGVQGTFYIAAGCVGNGEPLWLVEVIYRIRNTRRKTLTLSTPGQSRESSDSVTLPLANEKDKARAIRKAIEIIKSNNLRIREDIRGQLKDQMSDVDGCEKRAREIMLTWDQIREMRDNGMTIAGHTLTHLNLPNAEPADAFREIIGCKERIETRLGCPARHFSYPNGGNYSYYNETIMRMVKEAGFVTATTSNNGVVFGGGDPLALRRVRVTDHLPEIVYQIDCEPVAQRIKTRLRHPFRRP